MAPANGWKSRGLAPKLLLLTHGHFDHIPDVAKIKRRFGCQLGCHADTVPMISDPDFFRDYGFELEVETAQPDFLIEATPARDFLRDGIPDPGGARPFTRQSLFLFARAMSFSSVAMFFLPAASAGGICPGGDGDLLFHGIKTKLFPLGDNITVLPGHGPPTTIGEERRTNPFVR